MSSGIQMGRSVKIVGSSEGKGKTVENEVLILIDWRVEPNQQIEYAPSPA